MPRCCVLPADSFCKPGDICLSCLGDEFKASHLGDYGNVTVMEVSGGMMQKAPAGW